MRLIPKWLFFHPDKEGEEIRRVANEVADNFAVDESFKADYNLTLRKEGKRCTCFQCTKTDHLDAEDASDRLRWSFKKGNWQLRKKVGVISLNGKLYAVYEGGFFGDDEESK